MDENHFIRVVDKKTYKCMRRFNFENNLYYSVQGAFSDRKRLSDELV
jgi:hypothetical protein